jgi:hypothetical protein
LKPSFFLVLIWEEEKLPFLTQFNPIRPNIHSQSKPQTKNTAQNKLTQNFAPSLLLLLNSFQKIQLESNSIYLNAIAFSLFTDILVYGKYSTKLATGTILK